MYWNVSFLNAFGACYLNINFYRYIYHEKKPYQEKQNYLPIGLMPHILGRGVGQIIYKTERKSCTVMRRKVLQGLNPKTVVFALTFVP